MAGQHKVVTRKKNLKSPETLYNEDTNTKYGLMSKATYMYMYIPRIFHGHDGSDEEPFVSNLGYYDDGGGHECME